MSKPSDDLFSNIGRSTKARADRQKGGFRDVADLDAFPFLAALLAELPQGMNGATRPGAITLFCQDGRLTAVIKCPAMKSRAFVTLEAFDRVFVDLERSLRDSTLNWEVEKAYSQDGGYKRS